jgi:hypothetical protein
MPLGESSSAPRPQMEVAEQEIAVRAAWPLSCVAHQPPSWAAAPV